MSAVVYQAGLPSCLEPQVTESRTLRLKLASPKPNISNSFFDTNTSPNNNGGWSFIQAISTVSSSSYSFPKQHHVERYVHPKCSPSMFSDMSLALCTENLGSETGTDDLMDTSLFFLSSFDDDKTRSPLREQAKVCAKKSSATRSFPPPLTTMRGSDHSIRFRPHREDGRLVIKAIKTPLKESLFQAERNHGRLRLSFLKNDTDINSEENGVEIAEENGEDNISLEITTTSCDKDLVSENEEEGMYGNKMEVGGSTGMKKNQMMPSRCKEDRHGNNGVLLLNKEPFLVATSKTISSYS